MSPQISVALFLLLGLLAPGGSAQVLFVDGTASGAGDGSSWADAFPSLGDALAAAGPGAQVWIAEGTYLPPPPGSADPREATFALPDGVALFGGFAGGETSLAQRDPAAHPSVLSGDIGVPGVGDDNSYHVVTATAVSARLDGLVVRGGRAAGHPQDLVVDGGGLYGALGPLAGELTLVGCTFTDNLAARHGGAIALSSAEKVLLAGCTFEDNEAGWWGGAVLISGAGSADLQLCTFRDNRTTDPLQGKGGAVFLATGTFGGSPSLIEGCTFEDNVSGIGGAVCAGNSLRITDSRFVGNEASFQGGGLGLAGFIEVSVSGCLFLGNAAAGSGGGASVRLATVDFARCTFAGNTSGNGGAVAHLDSLSAHPVPVVSSFASTVFSGNSAARGGAVFSNGFVLASFDNCTVSGNDATVSGGALHNEEFQNISGPPVSPVVAVGNSILWGNTAAGQGNEAAQVANLHASVTSLHHSIVQGWTGVLGGAGNSGADPSFVDADGADDIPGTDDDDLRLAAGSPAIDAGDTAALPPDAADVDCDGDLLEPLPLDRTGWVRVVDEPASPDTGPGAGPVVDLGAFEHGSQLPADVWVDLGGGSSGSAGTPHFAAAGTLCAGQPFSLTLESCPPSTLALLWLSVSSSPVAALGGTLHAVPFVAQGLVATDGSGAFAAGAPWPYGAPAGLDLWLQCVVLDGGVPAGLALSNAVRGTTP